MSPWKNRLVVLVIMLLCFSSPLFVLTGYSALFQAWPRGDLEAALPFLSWARGFGILAMTGATAALGILFASKTFPIQPKNRLWLSMLATATISLYSEFRNEGKFHFKNLHHFFAPGTWIHDWLNRPAFSIGDFLYRIEYSHWNDFLMGPAIVSVLFSLVFFSIYSAFRNPGTISLTTPAMDESTDLDHKLRFARILMNVGLFWFFIQAWAEKAGYLMNPHSADEVDLPFEFAGTVVGFWMARILTGPFDKQSEKFSSTFLIDFVSSGVIGLFYTVIIGPLTEGIAGVVGHALYPVVPKSVEIHVYTPFQQHMRPLELLLLATATWWTLNRLFKREEITRLGGFYEEPGGESKWHVLKIMAKTLAVLTAYLLIVAAMFSLLEPQGVGWTLTTLGSGMCAGTVAFLLFMRATRQGFTTLFSRKNDASDVTTPANVESKSPPH